MNPRKPDVIVIGGGLSGLSTAVDLASRGLSVFILEQHQHLGGRAYSFADKNAGGEIDNGQHLMMGCYHETRWLLRTIGSDHLATVTFQNFFRMYHRLAGMTGTAETEATELHSIYKLDVIVVPTNMPMIRTDFADTVYSTRTGKKKAIVEEIKELHAKGQPMLVGDPDPAGIEDAERAFSTVGHDLPRCSGSPRAYASLTSRMPL